MSSVVWILILAIAAAGIAFVVLRRAAAPRPHPKYEESDNNFVAPVTTNSPPTKRRAYYGAVFDPGQPCCDAAQRLNGQRFLSADAPHLPLPDCDQKTCKCVIAPSQDRRQPRDRRDEDLAIYADPNDIIATAKREHREKQDRRGS